MTVFKFCEKVLMPFIIAMVLAGELYISGLILMAQPEFIYHVVGGLTLTFVVGVIMGLSYWFEQVFKKD